MDGTVESYERGVVSGLFQEANGIASMLVSQRRSKLGKNEDQFPATGVGMYERLKETKGILF